MNWIIAESNNIPLILCGVFYSILCIFSIVTGLIYASGRKKLNPLELSDKFMEKLTDEDKLKKFTKKMGWVTFVVGIAQGLTALAIFKGYNVFLNTFAIAFTIFSICSVIFKLKGKINIFPIVKLIFYIIILVILALAGINNYSATDEAIEHINSSENVKVSKIKEGYFFDGPGEDTAIIFFPGARVQNIAYAKLMHKIAKNGQDCFLLSETLNLAFFNVNTPEEIIKNYNYKKWYISGHSLGGVTASLYASDKPENITGIISLSSYPTKKLPANIEYISIYGSEDKVINTEKLKEAEQYLPNNHKEYIIDGANHSGFANYGEQKGDGKAKITSEQQQDSVVNVINNFTNSNSKPNELVQNDDINETNGSEIKEDRVDMIKIQINNNTLEVKLEDNEATKSLVDKLKNGDIIVNAKEYGGFEKVGNLGFSLPRSDTNINTSAGDVMLYQGNQISLFYNSSSWSYTKIGKVQNASSNDLKNILGTGDVTLRLSL